MADDDALSIWSGRLAGRPRPVPTITIRAPRQRARSSGTGAFLGLASDGRQYWVKVPGNEQGNRVLVNEVVVSEVGKLIGAPVRERALALVPPYVTTWQDFPTSSSSTPLVAHASLHVPDAVDDDDLRYTKRDDNARRQGALVGLWDLCVGEDPQWLYETAAGYSVWSYDHGLWFTTGEGDWNTEILVRLVDTDGSMPKLPAGLDNAWLANVADRIAGITAENFLSVVSAVPVEWGIDDRDLEAMAWFLFRRREPVAARLRQLAKAPSGRMTGSSK